MLRVTAAFPGIWRPKPCPPQALSTASPVHRDHYRRGAADVGIVQICWAEPVQVSMSSLAWASPRGSVRHRLECGLTSSPFAAWLQVWAEVPLHGYQSTTVPLPVPSPSTSRHPASVRSVLSV